ncbi:MAG: ABC-type transport system involved in resistance to organic solvents, permease component [uncultured Sulfurovum sp.]|uniref:ABC-type transport system involved in resistance to organic solvents, permease component n=1 Tax=uncultured Sulfurovum sp. TaxID=269237 RepID=A0A6S6SQ43_9BACT|nr:MAG: ABC-type transport system involved in resistance to organic solvents, permease component [uncultured Sulfurovum sp.]
MEAIFSFIGTPFVRFMKSMENFGGFIIFQLHLLLLMFKRPWRIKQIFEQLEVIGVGTFGVIFLTALFLGLIEAVQLYQGFSKFGAESFMGYTIFISISRELAPLLAGLMVTAQAISSMSAELGTMRVTEQIDAIETLAVDSKKYLLVPRIIATTIAVPLLVLAFDFISNSSAFLMAWLALDMNPVVYQDSIKQLLHFSDIGTGVLKGLAYGYLIGSIGTYVGYHTSGGAKGVGISTTKAVVLASVTIFIADLFISIIFLALDW